ncbi:sulfite exporter TauE/SafE family protein [Aquabacterium sp. A08]|uniref:sulfite exporter TauE/SafE family protein n=1 Tax=Aquabacterium sp. A08 TaxID=2718532 RepID=UPI001422A2DA|nr:sulfite exporter TauE/SafE family protein [Aquabacterium sp. A08]NIC42321.1 sulfite exporter TauE/SafE family protein [Aquabacterium sp. A08]
MEPWTTSALLALAAFAAGVLNAIAGGGSFLTFPALVFAGVPPIVANATSALAVSPGYLGSTLGFRAELQRLPGARLRQETLLAAVGGVAGALLLLVTPARVFSGLVPWLLLFATALFVLGPWLARRGGGAPAGAAHPLERWRPLGLLAVAVYGGYFNGGLGILLLALYTVTGEPLLHRANALKNLNSLVLSVLSVATFALAGAIAWGPALLMMVAATAGGYAGAHWAQRLPVAWVRGAVVATGVGMSGLFFVRG